MAEIKNVHFPIVLRGEATSPNVISQASVKLLVSTCRIAKSPHNRKKEMLAHRMVEAGDILLS
jgi:hypothetical protein